MFAPAISSQFFKGDVSHTYTHHTGSKHRIDYILIPQASRSLPQIARVVDIGYGVAGADHDAVVHDVSLFIAKSKPSCSIVKYDPDKFKSDWHRDYFRELLSHASFDH